MGELDFEVLEETERVGVGPGASRHGEGRDGEFRAGLKPVDTGGVGGNMLAVDDNLEEG